MSAMTWRSGLMAVLAAGAVMAMATAQPASNADPKAGPVARVGEKAPDFTLKDLEGNEHTLSRYTADGKIVVLEWFNPLCPWVQKHHEKHKTMKELAESGRDKGVIWLAINSGREGDETSDPDLNRRMAREWGLSYPVLMDPTGKVGRAYGARTTPHMFVIDAQGVLRYAGAIDDNRSPFELGSTNYVREALAALWAGETVAVAETRPYGCTVKY